MPKMKKDFERIDDRLKSLESASIRELKQLWSKYFDGAPPRQCQRSFLIRRIGYHMQAMAYGGLSKSMRSRLKRLAADPTMIAPPRHTITPGTRIVKDWKGQRVVVMVEGRGQFRYDGRIYSSLSAIASELAGSRQSGPHFFGLVPRRSREVG